MVPGIVSIFEGGGKAGVVCRVALTRLCIRRETLSDHRSQYIKITLSKSVFTAPVRYEILECFGYILSRSMAVLIRWGAPRQSHSDAGFPHIITPTNASPEAAVKTRRYEPRQMTSCLRLIATMNLSFRHPATLPFGASHICRIRPVDFRPAQCRNCRPLSSN